jgi:glutamine amidotransferase
VIAVLDYGIGNLRSAEKALQRVGADARLVDDPDDVAVATGALSATGLARAATEAVARGIPFLGICVGFQLLYEGSEEDPAATGLAILPGTVRRLPNGVKHPQMQWNTLEIGRSDLLVGVPDPAWVYFVHSFAPERTGDTTSMCDYGGPVVASAERDRVWGTQFHPEKSGAVGLGILANFVAAVDAVA